jgi:hypothetical protein
LPIESFENGLIALSQDSVNVTNFTIQKDTSNTRSVLIKYRWRVGSKYQLVLNEAAFTDIYGDKNKRTGINFEADKPENYSQLTLQVTIPDSSKRYVVELMDEAKTIMRSDPISKSTSIVYKNYLTGKYTSQDNIR